MFLPKSVWRRTTKTVGCFYTSSSRKREGGSDFHLECETRPTREVPESRSRLREGVAMWSCSFTTRSNRAHRPFREARWLARQSQPRETSEARPSVRLEISCQRCERLFRST